MTLPQLPLIGVTGDTHPEKDSNYYKVGDKYMLSVVRAAKGLAVMIPPIADELEMDALLDHLDGVVFTGSFANLDPALYGAEPVATKGHRDPGRDATNLPLMKRVMAREIPMFCICRGHQELNVIMGGTLHQQVHEEDGNQDHRADENKPYDVRYGPQHDITIQPGGVLEQVYGSAARVKVNTVHEQAIETPGPGLRVEAMADDGVIEAVSIEGLDSFNISVQWHPEHHVALQEPLNTKLFEAFGDAARERLARRNGQATGKTQAA